MFFVIARSIRRARGTRSPQDAHDPSRGGALIDSFDDPEEAR